MEQNNEFISNEDIIYFNLQVIDKKNKFIKDYPETLSFSYFVKDTLPHPATFIKKELFESVGLYDENLKIVSDWKWFIKAVCNYNVSYKKMDAILSTFYLDGISADPKSRNLIVTERQSVLNSEYAAYNQDIDDVVKYRSIISGLRRSRTIKLLIKLGFLNKF